MRLELGLWSAPGEWDYEGGKVCNVIKGNLCELNKRDDRVA